jgi:hypothetical protein
MFDRNTCTRIKIYHHATIAHGHSNIKPHFEICCPHLQVLDLILCEKVETCNLPLKFTVEIFLANILKFQKAHSFGRLTYASICIFSGLLALYF